MYFIQLLINYSSVFFKSSEDRLNLLIFIAYHRPYLTQKYQYASKGSTPYIPIFPGLGLFNYYLVLVDSILWVLASLLVILGVWWRWKWLLLPKLVILPLQIVHFIVNDTFKKKFFAGLVGV